MMNFLFTNKIEVMQTLGILQTRTDMILKKDEALAKNKNSSKHNDISFNKANILKTIAGYFAPMLKEE